MVAVGGSRWMIDRQKRGRRMQERGSDRWVGLVTVVGGVWRPLHAGDESFQGVSISMTSPGGPSVGGGGVGRMVTSSVSLMVAVAG